MTLAEMIEAKMREPKLGRLPQMFGSAGEPTLGKLPVPIDPVMSGPMKAPMVPPKALPMGLMIAGLLGSRNAGGPEMMQQEISADIPPEMPVVDIMPDAMPFRDAFAKARKMGLVEFTWRGRNFNTKYREEQ